MKGIKFYVNRVTREETMSRRDAMFWYRSGFPVEVWKDDRMVLALVM